MLSLCPDRDLLLRSADGSHSPFDPWRLAWRDEAVPPGAAAPVAHVGLEETLSVARDAIDERFASWHAERAVKGLW